MEDRNVLAADSIVICCCCQCLILQILVFILLKIPYKLFKKTKQYAKKLKTRRKGGKVIKVKLTRYDEDSLRHHGRSFRMDIEEFIVQEPILDEIERVFDEFSRNGEFAFGSFWGGDVSSRSFRSCLKEDELDYDDVQYRLFELFGSVNFN